MKNLLQRNLGRAFSEVVASVAGTLGIVYAISFIISRQDEAHLSHVFQQYFSGGQIGLPILSLSGIILILLFRRGPIDYFFSLFLAIIFLGSIMSTAFIIGINPGFHHDKLSTGNLSTLWMFYFLLHALWFVILLLEPAVPSAQEAGEVQEERVQNLMAKSLTRYPIS